MKLLGVVESCSEVRNIGPCTGCVRYETDFDFFFKIYIFKNVHDYF